MAKQERCNGWKRIWIKAGIPNKMRICPGCIDCQKKKIEAKINYRQVPDVLRELGDEVSKLDAKKLESKVLNSKEKKRYLNLDNFFIWLMEVGFYHKLNKLSPFIDKKSLDDLDNKLRKLQNKLKRLRKKIIT